MLLQANQANRPVYLCCVISKLFSNTVTTVFKNHSVLLFVATFAENLSSLLPRCGIFKIQKLTFTYLWIQVVIRTSEATTVRSSFLTAHQKIKGNLEPQKEAATEVHNSL